MTAHCAYCLHDEPGDLVKSADSRGNLILACRDEAMCDMRAYERELHLGLHLENVQ